MANVLLHIGFPKAGSTYLQSWFGAHPAMHFSQKGIAGFSNTHDIARFATSNEPLPEWFVLSCEDLGVWRGEPDIVGLKSTRLYDFRAYQQKLCDTLFALYPAAKILLITRGYASLFSSFYSQYLVSGGTSAFDELLKDYGQFFTMGYDYQHVIPLYRQKFGAGNVLVLPYELLRENPTDFVSRIERWMGLGTAFPFVTEKINASLDKQVLTAYGRVSNLVYKTISPLPYSWKKKIYGAYLYRLNKVKPEPFIKFVSGYVKEDFKMPGLEKMLESLRGKAYILKQEELYKPYLKEYLLD